MCGKTPKPPKVTTIVKDPEPTESAVRVQETAAQTEQSRAGATRQTMRRFDLKLPSNFDIPR
jgi:hypothetical protein